ncbi:hypothetical protein HDV05_001575, partial [Chytridiales sp. JEL 0842]
ADRSGNIRPGLVVDGDITHPTYFDFYLNSHAGLQGTSRPAHYTVLYDENKFSPDELQQMVFNLCYGYGRATKAVSVCPPAYYAHLAAKRATLHFTGGFGDSESGLGSGSEPSFTSYQERFKPVHTRLNNTMYYV